MKINSLKNLAISCAVALAMTSCAMPFALLSGHALDSRAESTLKAASKDLKEGRKGRAITSLKGMRKDLYGSAWGNRAAFLLAVAYVKDNDAGSPETGVYLDEAGRIDAIKDYTLFYHAQYLSMQGDFTNAATAYADLMRLYPASVLVPQALYKKAQISALSGDNATAREDLLRFASEYPGHALAPDALLDTARLTIAENDIEAALKHLYALVIRHPTHPAAKEAEKLIPLLREYNPGLPELSVAERFERGEAFFNTTKFIPAIAEYKTVAASGDPEYRAKALLKTAQALMRLKRYDEAERTLKELAAADSGPEDLYLLAVCQARQGKLEDLVETEKAMASKFPKAKERIQTTLLTGRMFEERAMPERAKDAYNGVLRDFKEDPLYLDALWSLGWLYYRSGSFGEAYKIFSSQTSGKAGEEKFAYWGARSAEKAGMKDAAMGLYRSLRCGDGISYYCRLSVERLAGLNGSVAGVTGARVIQAAAEGASAQAGLDHIRLIKEKNDGDPRFIAAKELLVLGMNEEASAEVAALSRKASPGKDALLAISGLFYDTGDYYRGLKAYRRYQSVSGTFVEAGGAAIGHASYAFPTGPVEMAKACMDAAAADPHLVAAIMREESEFNAGAVSRTGALGVMQIMPATGRLVAKAKGAGFNEGDLFDPTTNIRLGSRYLTGLIKRFNGNLVLAIAAYNAGPNAVSGWMKTLPVEADEFIESIPYSETRSYTKRVLRSYKEYQRLAGDGLPANVSPIKPLGDKSVGGKGVNITENPVSGARNAAAREKDGVGF